MQLGHSSRLTIQTDESVPLHSVIVLPGRGERSEYRPLWSSIDRHRKYPYCSLVTSSMVFDIDPLLEKSVLASILFPSILNEGSETRQDKVERPTECLNMSNSDSASERLDGDFNSKRLRLS